MPQKGDKVARHKTPAARIVAPEKPISSGRAGAGQSTTVAALHAPPGARQGETSAIPVCPTHIVRPGETLFSIAAGRLGNGKDWKRIRDANRNLDPTRLKPGMRLALPCAEPMTASAGTTKTGAAKAIAGATGKTGTADGSKHARVGTDASAPKPAPLWTAKKGESFRAVIQRWARRAGHTVIIDTSDAWTIAVPVRLEGDFRTAIGALVRGLSHDGVAPPVRI